MKDGAVGMKKSRKSGSLITWVKDKRLCCDRIDHTMNYLSIVRISKMNVFNIISNSASCYHWPPEVLISFMLSTNTVIESSCVEDAAFFNVLKRLLNETMVILMFEM